MSNLIDTNAQDWQALRPELTTGVSGKGSGLPGGCYAPHCDKYGDLFHFLSG